MIGNILGTTAFNTNELADYNAANDYFATPISGNCVDSDQCPIRIKDGDLILIDMGCKYKGYCSDMTRVLFVNYCIFVSIKYYEFLLFLIDLS